MQTQQREHKMPSWARVVFAIVGIILILAGTTIGIIQGTLFNTVSVVLAALGAAFALCQWLLPLSSNASQSTTVPAPTSAVPQIIVQVPTVQPPPQVVASYRGIVSIHPPTDPQTIQQREKAVKEIYTELLQLNITAIVLTGIGGAGKSTLAALVYDYTEKQRLAGSGPFKAEALWLHVDQSVTIVDIVGNLFESIGKPIPDLSSLSMQNKAAVLFNALNTADKPRLVVLDQFENLLDVQTGQALPDRPGISEWIDAINSQPCRCRILLTSRPRPQGTREYPPTYMREYPVAGLEEAEGVELLRKQGIKGTEEELHTAVERCAGHAFALILLTSLLQKRSLSLTTLFKDQENTQLWTGDIARNLLDTIYTRQLNEEQRTILVAFSIYREPRPLGAVLTVMNSAHNMPRAQMELDLDALLAQHLVQASGEGLFQLHTIVADYAKSHFVAGDEEANKQALIAAHSKAAQYYQQQAATSCSPREKRRSVSDVHDLIEATWHHCEAEQWQAAYDLMEQEHIFPDVNRWGGNAILLELYLLFPLEKWNPEPAQAVSVRNELGWIYGDLGKSEKALKYHEEALHISRKVGDRAGEGDSLSLLGRTYLDLGRSEEALKYLEESLRISQERGDRHAESVGLNNLGGVYFSQGKLEEALKYYEESLRIGKEIGRDEGTALASLGSLYDNLGKLEEARKCYEESLRVNKEAANRQGEGIALWGIGQLYFKQQRYDVALAYLLLAKGILEELGSPYVERVQRWIDRLRRKVGEGQLAALLTQVEPRAQEIVEQTLREGV